jgi:hypothetical protein
MGSQVSIDNSGVKEKIKRMSALALQAVCEQMLSDCRQYVPKQEGMLRDSARIEKEGEDRLLIWDTPYAAYQYYGCWPDGTHAIKNHSTPGTTTFWVDEAKKSRYNEWIAVAQAAAERL